MDTLPTTFIIHSNNNNSRIIIIIITLIITLIVSTGSAAVDAGGFAGVVTVIAARLDCSAAARTRGKTVRGAKRGAPRTSALAAAERATDDAVAVDALDAISARAITCIEANNSKWYYIGIVTGRKSATLSTRYITTASGEQVV